jgi:hypothetical protein
MHLAELADQQEHPLEEIVTPTRHPKRLGNWVTAMVKPAPILKPTRILSLINLTSTLSRNSQANTQSTATVNAARLAICA